MKVLEKIRVEVFTKIQKTPLSFFQKYQSGDLLSRTTSDTAQLQNAVLSISNDLIRQPITFIGAIAALIVMAVQREGMSFVLFCLLAIPLCVFPIRRGGHSFDGQGSQFTTENRWAYFCAQRKLVRSFRNSFP